MAGDGYHDWLDLTPVCITGTLDTYDMSQHWNIPGLPRKQEEDHFEKEAADKKLNLSKILITATNLKAIHIKTRKYGSHMAFDQAFDALNESLDSLIEGIQGYYIAHTGGALTVDSREMTFVLPADAGVISACKKLEKDFATAVDPLVKGITPLESLRDDVLNCFYQLYYRLNLKG